MPTMSTKDLSYDYRIKKKARPEKTSDRVLSVHLNPSPTHFAPQKQQQNNTPITIASPTAHMASYPAHSSSSCVKRGTTEGWGGVKIRGNVCGEGGTIVRVSQILMLDRCQSVFCGVLQRVQGCTPPRGGCGGGVPGVRWDRYHSPQRILSSAYASSH